MEDSRQKWLMLLDKAVNDSDLPAGDIPQIDLYIDQIITLLETALSVNKRKEDDKLLTKTMINNYSKEGLLKPIKGKKYAKDHIIQMLLVYELKQVLSIGDIKSVMDVYNLQEEFTPAMLTDCYQSFLSIKNTARSSAAQAARDALAQLPKELPVNQQLFLLLLVNAALSRYHKRICETLIDSCLTEE